MKNVLFAAKSDTFNLVFVESHRTRSGFFFCGQEFINFISADFPTYVVRSLLNVPQDGFMGLQCTLTFPHDGRVTPLIPFQALLHATTLEIYLEKLRDMRMEHISASQHQNRR